MSASETKAPFASFEWMMAFRYLRSRRRETFISIISWLSFCGIMLGVATLIIVMAVMNGFRTELLDKILGINGHLVIQPQDSPLTDYDTIAKRVEGVDGVRYVVPFVEGQILASGPGGAVGALVRGMSGESVSKLKLVSSNVLQGSFEGFDDGEGIALGSRIARLLGVVLGDSVTLISPKGAVTPMGVAPRIKSYKVKAVFEIGMSEYDSSFIFMPLAAAQAYFNQDQKVSAIEVYVDDPDAVGQMRPMVEEAVDRQIYITDWRFRNVTFFSALEVERNLMFIILTLIILVAALNIISGLIMLVKDKGSDIAILRTMGATRASIMRIFMMTGAAIGFVGTVAGFILGLLVCLNIESIRQFVSWITRTELFSPELYFLSKLPADMDVTETVSVVLIALVLSFLATLYPAWRASTLDPVEALRYE
ncbi:lipoprotein-releasing ABC transporter permease subunit [Cohaesibacter sp. CAU 1516]|uniref:lipoprotein-releasing ABC transporter permease subunit n=1 Tax=Cohaesibacter sp. CAU 1516 TaxID=2576038 RepID=UPI0010FE3E82|nr:lipoprotein-releasing ABC transporter permease subunit [Cohaesibacter sp. CAU 1516]TLP49017.1 lipoprotein-releasing ABC transporter permease subunit [Cohaesibacter sp. CAU 1516]